MRRIRRRWKRRTEITQEDVFSVGKVSLLHSQLRSVVSEAVTSASTAQSVGHNGSAGVREMVFPSQ